MMTSSVGEIMPHLGCLSKVYPGALLVLEGRRKEVPVSLYDIPEML